MVTNKKLEVEKLKKIALWNKNFKPKIIDINQELFFLELQIIMNQGLFIQKLSIFRRHQILPNAGSFSPNANNDSFDLSSDFNASIRALPETNTNPRPGFEPSTMSDKLDYPIGNMATTHFGGSPSLFSGSSNRQFPTTSSPIKNPSNIPNRDSNPGQLDNLCQLEETDDEDLDTPIVENKPLTMAKITQVQWPNFEEKCFKKPADFDKLLKFSYVNNEVATPIINNHCQNDSNYTFFFQICYRFTCFIFMNFF